jgi:DNA-binding beta-propeller fold protein YncE
MSRRDLLSIVVAALLAGCEGAGGVTTSTDEWNNLAAVPNPNEAAVAQPRRGNPFAVAVTADGRALVTLRGSELAPGNDLVAVDLASRRVVGRVGVGDRPVAVHLHPDGDLAVVLSSFSPLAAVVDTGTLQVTSKLEVGYYAEALVFSADGSRMFFTSRASDELIELSVTRSGSALLAGERRAVRAGVNPTAIALSADGAKLYVADQGGLGVRVFDAGALIEIAFIEFNAPVFDLKPMGAYIIATTLNDTNGLPCVDDGDFPGEQGDGVFEVITDRTCSRGFGDLQNEIAFIDPERDEVAVRYTSDTAEVSEADREGDHAPALMKVVGALPHSIAVISPTRAFVTMGASFELIELAVDASGPTPLLEVSQAWDTGLAPRGVAIDPEARFAAVANLLGETLSVFDLQTGERDDVAVGVTSPAFPATGAEIGALFFFTSKYATDGDQSCSHCHPDAGGDGKAWGVEVVRRYGRRATIPTRNLHATRPLLVEGVFEETDFSLEVEGISFRPDFHDSSYVLQVQRRDRFFRERSGALLGRGVGFTEMIGHLGEFLIAEPRLLPSPFPRDTAQVARGRTLYFRFDVACAACHPSPAFASPESFSGITTMARFDRPSRSLDPDTSIKFIENARDGFFNANTLRGLWDRQGALLHDGRAATIREILLTPDHPCLVEGERGFNESQGAPDTHGGTSHLRCDEIDDLVAFLLTID